MTALNLTEYGKMYAFNQGQGNDLEKKEILPAGGEIQAVEVRNGLWQIGMEWPEARDITAVEAVLSPDSPQPEQWYVEYWGSAWPLQPPAYRLGASNGWLKTEDPYHGHWRRAYGTLSPVDKGVRLSFDPMDIVEFEKRDAPSVEHFFQSEELGVNYRRTLKVRLMMKCPSQPKLTRFCCLNEGPREGFSFRIIPRALGKKEAPTSGQVCLYNSSIQNQATFLAGESVLLSGDFTLGGCEGDQTQLVFSFDSGEQGFAILAKDAAKGVYMTGADLLVIPAQWEGTPREIIASLTAGKRSIYDRIGEHAEQTLENAFREMPAMDVTKQTPYGRYVILGWEGIRQKFCLRYNGDLFADKLKQKVSKRDCAGTKWAGGCLHFRVGSGDPIHYGEGREDRRQYEPDPAVPLGVTEWVDRHIEYRESTFAFPRETPVSYARGDEEMLLFARFEMRNLSDTPRTAALSLNLYPSEEITLQGNELYAVSRVLLEDAVETGWRRSPYERPRLRALISPQGGRLRSIPAGEKGLVKGNLPNSDFYDFYDGYHYRHEASGTIDGTLLYEKLLQPGERVQLDVLIPYLTYEDKEEIEKLKAFTYDQELERVRSFWHQFASSSAAVTLPESSKINDFVKAVPRHIRISASRDVDTGFYVVPAASYFYGACGNEGCMQIDLMDALGQHEIAERYLESFIDSQGAGSLDGAFTGYDGALVVNDYSNPENDPDMMFAYNLDHGYILECFARHYRMTGSREWLTHAAPAMIRGCDFVTNQRRKDTGLLPPGRLEDNAEWRSWFAVNAHACSGMFACGDVLKELDEKEANRIQKDAEDYRQAILRNVKEGIANSSAVPDGNGGYMPQVPIRTQIRGRDWGWFRQTAYGPLHLVREGLLDPKDPLTTLILRDLEDNLFISRNWGRNVDKEKNWFTLGGNTVQSNLLFNDRVYLQRQQPSYAVRSLLNNFAQNLYRDMNCFTEHPIPEFGFGFGPFFKTSDEAQFLLNLRDHLLLEEGEELRLLPGCALEWLKEGEEISFENLSSWFGPVTFRYGMKAGCLEAEGHLKGVWRKVPRIRLLLRHPEGKLPSQVTLNGEPCKLVGEEAIFVPAEGENIITVRF